MIKQWGDNYKTNGHWRWAITLNDEVIGIISVKVIDNDNNVGEISFGIGSSYWGEGSGTEAVKAVLSYCSESTLLKKIIAVFDKRNIRALNLASKCNFSYSREIQEFGTSEISSCDLYEKFL